MVVDAAHDDGVDLERIEARGGGRVDSVEHRVEAVEARHLAEPLAIERVEADRDPVQAGGAERGRLGGQQDAVGRQRQVPDGRPGRQRRDERREIAPEERLAAGQPHAIDAEVAEGVGDGADFLEREQRILRQPRIVRLRHAVEAAQVAPVGHRYAQAAKRAPETVENRHGDTLIILESLLSSAPLTNHCIRSFVHASNVATVSRSADSRARWQRWP